MAQVTIGGGRVVCEMDEAAQAEYEKVARWLGETITARNDAYAALKVTLSERDTARETHQTLVAERNAARAEAAALRAKLLDELSDSETQRLQAAAERDVARKEAAELREQLEYVVTYRNNLIDELAATRAEVDKCRNVIEAWQRLSVQYWRPTLLAATIQSEQSDTPDNSSHVAP